MRRSKREFGIHHAFFKEGVLFVDGRCFEGPLRVGDVFRQLYRLETEPPDKFEVSDCRRVRLRIDEINFYGQTIDSIDGGNTARLRLSGENTELVRDEWHEVLGIEPPETAESS